MIRRLENDIPLDKVIVVQGCGGQSVAFTAIFPPLKKTVKVIDVIDMPNTKIPLPVAGGGSPYGSRRGDQIVAARSGLERQGHSGTGPGCTLPCSRFGRRVLLPAGFGVPAAGPAAPVHMQNGKR